MAPAAPGQVLPGSPSYVTVRPARGSPATRRPVALQSGMQHTGRPSAGKGRSQVCQAELGEQSLRPFFCLCQIHCEISRKMAPWTVVGGAEYLHIGRLHESSSACCRHRASYHDS